MAEQMRPASAQQAPDPSTNYERAHPDREAGQGRLTNNVATPAAGQDGGKNAVGNRQNPTRQVNAQDTTNARADAPAPVQPDHSMKDEEPLGWDQAPTDEHAAERQRHPRREGKGGVD